MPQPSKTGVKGKQKENWFPNDGKLVKWGCQTNRDSWLSFQRYQTCTYEYDWRQRS